MKIEEFPTISEIEKSILKLMKMDFPKYSDEMNVDEYVDRVTQIFRNELGHISYSVKPLTHKDFSLKLYRVRELESISNIDLIREHSYPPVNAVKLGRCNFPKFPVFYCSDNPMTALIELLKSEKNYEKNYCISKWEIEPTEEILFFESLFQIDLPSQNNYTSFKEDFKKRINEPFLTSFNKKLNKEQEEGLLEYTRFLNNIFISDENYSLSASLAHMSLYAKHNLRTDILMYPSVQTYLKGSNLALNPNFVDNHLKLSRLYIVKLNNYNNQRDTVNLTFYKYGEIDKNVIMWKSIKPDDEHYKEIVQQDFGEYITNNFTESDEK